MGSYSGWVRGAALTVVGHGFILWRVRRAAIDAVGHGFRLWLGQVRD